MTTFLIIACCLLLAALLFCLVRLLYKQQSTVLTFQCERILMSLDAPRLGYVIRVHRDGAIDATVVYGELLAEYDLSDVDSQHLDKVLTYAIASLEHRLHEDYDDNGPDFAPLFNGLQRRQVFVSHGSNRPQFDNFKDARAYADKVVGQYIELA